MAIRWFLHANPLYNAQGNATISCLNWDDETKVVTYFVRDGTLQKDKFPTKNVLVMIEKGLWLECLEAPPFEVEVDGKVIVIHTATFKEGMS